MHFGLLQACTRLIWIAGCFLKVLFKNIFRNEKKTYPQKGQATVFLEEIRQLMNVATVLSMAHLSRFWEILMNAIGLNLLTVRLMKLFIKAKSEITNGFEPLESISQNGKSISSEQAIMPWFLATCMTANNKMSISRLNPDRLVIR